MQIYESTKFHYAKKQYRAEVGGFTVLRLTYGRNGGAIKTATARDDSGTPVYPDQGSLILATKTVLDRAGLGSELVIRLDGSRRVFGEVRGAGSEPNFLNFFGELAKEVGLVLGLEMVKSA